MVRQVRSRLGHAAGVARGADAAAFAGEGDQEVVATVIATPSRKAVGKDAAFEVLAKRLLNVGCRGVVITQAVKLSGACQL